MPWKLCLFFLSMLRIWENDSKTTKLNLSTENPSGSLWRRSLNYAESLAVVRLWIFNQRSQKYLGICCFTGKTLFRLSDHLLGFQDCAPSFVYATRMRTTLKNLHKISGSRISECQLSLLSGCREKKTRASQSGGFQRQRSHGCSIRPPTPTCPVADSPTLADAAGWGRRFLKLVGGAREDFDSQHAQSLCQLALPAFIRWNGGEKESPLKGGGQVGRVEGRGGTYIYIYGAALNNRYQKPPAWNCPSATGRVSPVRGDQRGAASVRVLCI